MSVPETLMEVSDQGDETRIRKESAGPRLVRSGDLLDGQREVWIEHAGVRYRLRVTRRNKLILQK